jgi:hypothetical protein
MKISVLVALAGSAALAVVVACSSSSNGGSGNYPTCQGNTMTTGSNSTACSSCVQSHCGSQISSVESSCSAFLSCFSGCMCSDLNCISGCASKIDSTCQNAESPLTTCQNQNCMSQCAAPTPDAG